MIEYYFVGLFLILTGRKAKLADDVHELALSLETVRQQFVHVLELIFLHDPIKAFVQSPEVLMVGEQRAVGLDPRAEDMHVIVLRVAVEVDEIRIVFGTELLHELMGYVYKLLPAFLTSLDGQGIVEL